MFLITHKLGPQDLVLNLSPPLYPETFSSFLVAQGLLFPGSCALDTQAAPVECECMRCTPLVYSFLEKKNGEFLCLWVAHA